MVGKTAAKYVVEANSIDPPLSQQDKMFKERAEVERSGEWYKDWQRLMLLLENAKKASKEDIEKTLVERAKSSTLSPTDALIASLLLSNSEVQLNYLFLLMYAENEKMLQYHNLIVIRELYPEDGPFEQWGKKASAMNAPLFFPFKELRTTQSMLHSTQPISGGGHYMQLNDPYWTNGQVRVRGGEAPAPLPTPVAVGGEIPMPVYAKDNGHHVDGQSIKDYIDHIKKLIEESLRREFEAKYGKLAQGQRPASPPRKQNQNRGNGSQGFNGQNSRGNWSKGVRGGSDANHDQGTGPKNNNDKDFRK